MTDRRRSRSKNRIDDWEAGYESRSRRRRKKRGCFWPLLILVFLLLAAWALKETVLAPFLPSKEMKDLHEWFEISGDQVQIYLDAEAEEEYTGIKANGTVYLPMEYVKEYLNGRFFWSPADQMLSYTLPDETLDFDPQAAVEISEQNDTADVSGTKNAPIFIEREGSVCIALDAVEKFSNFTDQRYLDDEFEVNRVFIQTGGREILEAETVKKTELRTKADVKAPILVKLGKNMKLQITERNDNWCRVVTENGFAGYVRTKAVSKPEAVQLENTYTEPEVTHTLMDGKFVMAWQGVYNKTGNTFFDELIANTQGTVNVVSPTWFQIKNAEGEYTSYASKEYVDKAHAAGIKVWAAIDNFNEPGGLKDFSTRDFFAESNKRRGFIQRMMADAAALGLDGWNLDFEGLPADAGESYIQFIRELSVECRKNGLVLSVDNYVPYGFNNFYNMKEQGVFADYIVVMLYDEHTDEAGSVASYDYTDFGLTETMNSVEPGRMVAGLPLYTRMWTIDEDGVHSETLGMKKAAKAVEDAGIQLNWDEETGQNYGELETETKVKRIWMEDAESLRRKMDLVRKYNAGGIAMWRLGYEPSEIWSELKYGN